MTILQEIRGVRTCMLMRGIKPSTIKMSRKHYEQLRDEVSPRPSWSYEPATEKIFGMKIEIV